MAKLQFFPLFPFFKIFDIIECFGEVRGEYPRNDCNKCWARNLCLILEITQYRALFANSLTDYTDTLQLYFDLKEQYREHLFKSEILNAMKDESIAVLFEEITKQSDAIDDLLFKITELETECGAEMMKNKDLEAKNEGLRHALIQAGVLILD